MNEWMNERMHFFFTGCKVEPEVAMRFQLDKLHYVCNTHLVQLGRRMNSAMDDADFRQEFDSFRTAYLQQYIQLQQQLSPVNDTRS